MHRTSLKNVQVLVVDDENDVLGLLGSFLRLAGARVEVADNAREGVRLVGEFEPDVIVSDLCMPEIDGYGFLHALTNLGRAAPPVIALTALHDPRERKRALEAGFADFMTKPFDPDDLLSKILAHARGAPLGTSA